MSGGAIHQTVTPAEGPGPRYSSTVQGSGAPAQGRGDEGFANPHRGEAALRVAGEMLVLRPSVAALVAAEQELGPLFAMVERAAEGRLALGEMVGLFWHCLRERPAGLTREAFGDAVAAVGLSAAMPVLRVLLQQILSGR